MRSEFFVAGLLLALLIATIWATGDSVDDKRQVTVRFPASLASYIRDTDENGMVLAGLINLDARLIEQWKESRAKGRTFSRGSSGDARARRDLYTPSTRFSEFQTSPGTVFAGTFELERHQTTLSFPILFDRRKDKTWVFVRGTWKDFEKWLVSKQGVHL